MNETIRLLRSHRTVREFVADEVLPQAHVQAVLDAARQAPSWMNGQCYGIVRVSDAALRAQIAALQPRNPQIGSAAEFWVFVLDLHRMRLCGAAEEALADTEALLVASTDTALAAQNAVVAAESLGYATCFIGGIRAVAGELVHLLALPRYVFPLVGLCFGSAAVEMRVKPRLPQAAVAFENRYAPDVLPLLEEYERTMAAFGEAREVFPWREKFARFYAQPFAPENAALRAAQGVRE